MANIALAPGVAIALDPALDALRPIEELSGPAIQQPERRSRQMMMFSTQPDDLPVDPTEEYWSMQLLHPQDHSPLTFETTEARAIDQRLLDVLRLHPALLRAVPDAEGRRIDVEDRNGAVRGLYDDGRFLIRAYGRCDADALRRSLEAVTVTA